MRRLIPIVAALPLPVLVPALAGASAPTVPAAGSAFATKLDELPAAFLGNESVVLSYTDMTLVWDRLSVGTDPEERLAALGRTADVETFSQPLELFGMWATDVEGARSEIGFSTFEIDREAALVAPPYRVIVADTSVSAAAISDAVTTDSLWSADLNDVDSDAGPYWTWGDDPMAQDLRRRSPMRQLGQGGAVAVVGDAPATVIRTMTAEDAESTMRTVGGTEASVLDEGPFAPMAGAVGDAEVVQALGTTAMATFMPPLSADVDEITEALESAVRFLPSASVTVVETLENGDYLTEILVIHLDPAIAEANAETAATWLAEGVDPMTGSPIAELLPEATVSTEGAVLRLALPSGTYSRAVRMLMAGALFPV